MIWCNEKIKDIEKELQTNFKEGLDGREAKKRIEKYGENTIESGTKRKNIFIRFLSQLNDFMVIVLIAAAAAAFFVSYINGENDFADSIVILLIVFINAFLGMIQEDKAEKAIEALKNMSYPKAKVLRDGRVKEIDTKDVVKGDVIIIETGDYICADARLIESINLKAEESSITGESLPVEKDSKGLFDENTPLGDRKNMVLSTSYITSGRGQAVVIATGMDTEVGKIAKLMIDEEENDTPLQRRLSQTGKQLGIGAIAICFAIFFMGLLRKVEPFEMFMTSVSLAVAAIPEGLTAIVTIVLAMGMQRMSKKNTIIRKLPAVETLGSASVICSDKTGTLTQNKMKVVTITDYKNKIESGEKRKFILTLAALCNNTRKNGKILEGEPTEKALYEAAEENGIDIEEKNEIIAREGEIPFSSERKLMSTIHKTKDGDYIAIIKGAPDILIERCTNVMEGEKSIYFDRIKKNNAKKINSDMASAALRVIAVGYKEFENKPPIKSENIENDIVFCGLIGMVDPPRPEVKEAVNICCEAGIKPVMITGDHGLTAVAMGKELGIYKNGDLYMTGKELDNIDDEKLEENINKYSVFARVAPEHKVRIVKAFQKKGNVVAMTGDGVNDAPALKSADIGCAMGKNGTDVAKGAADMILTDDNFATIVEAVKEGREIYDNIKKAVHFLLSSNIGEIITIFAAMCMGWATPLLPIHLLWVNLVTDSLPAIALGIDPADKDIMKRNPINNHDSMFAGGMGERIVLEGCMIGMLALIAFGVGHVYFDMEVGYAIGRTMAFAVLSISQLIHAFNMRTEKSLLKINILSNKFLVGALIIGILMQMSVIMIKPLSVIFKVSFLNLEQWCIVFGLSFIPIIVVELEKLISKPSNK